LAENDHYRGAFAVFARFPDHFDPPNDLIAQSVPIMLNRELHRPGNDCEREVRFAIEFQ
jgi:hypothetical protein